MCELFAYCSRMPARVRLEFREFARHGGPDAYNPDGWGAAYYEDVDAHVLREPRPATRSAFVHVLEQHDFHSPLVVAHIRRASRGNVALVNTQPFSRELFGRRHVFAHNGDLPDIERALPLPPSSHRPMGQTDSEHAFYVLQEALRPLGPGNTAESLAARIGVVADFAARLRALGPANFLYTDGDLLFAHAHRRHSGGTTGWSPGLHLLLRDARHEHQIQASGLEIHGHGTTPAPAALLASVPLTAEAWEPLPENTLLVLRQGVLLERL